MEIPILYQDDELVVINKPHGVLVHRSKMDFYEDFSATVYLKEKLQRPVYAVHRLDKPTSGILIFALSSQSAKNICDQFVNKEVYKEYHAIVRGIPPKSILIDYPLKEKKDPLSDKLARLDTPAQEAITQVDLLSSVEIPVHVDRYPTSRYSLVKAVPLTGRKHQIRRHLSHIRHPIIGDINHGTSKHNRFFEKEFKVRRLLLTCTQMKFKHPMTQQEMILNAPLSPEFQMIVERLNLNNF